MYNIKTMNHISPCGLQKLEARGCTVGENVSDPDGLILRSGFSAMIRVLPAPAFRAAAPAWVVTTL